MKANQHDRVGSYRKGQWLAVMVFLLGLLVSAAGWWLSRQDALRDLHQEFSAEAVSRASIIREVLMQHWHELESVQRFYNASDFVDRQEFKAFVAPILRPRAGIQAIEWIPRVALAERHQFEEAARREWLQDFRFYQLGPQGEPVAAAQRGYYYPVYYLEPLTGNEKAAGFDAGSNPARLAALETARDTGQATGTEGIRLVQETGQQTGFLIFIPIYGPKMPLESTEQREQALLGFVLGVFRTEDIITAAIGTSPKKNFRTELTDLSAPAGKQELYRSPQIALGPQSFTWKSWLIPPATLKYIEPFMFAGRQWRISIEATQAYVLEHIHLSYWWILLVGMMFSCLAALYLGNVLSRQEKAEALVAERTRELLAEKQLSDDIINSLPGAFYLYNEQGKFLRWNKNLEQTSGYSHDEVAQMTPVDFFVGEEKIRLRQAIIESFRTGENVFEATAQVRGGNLIPFLFTNLRIDYNGVPCIIGMGLDISERKQAEEALERTREQLAEGQRIAHLGSWEYLAATGTTFWSDEEKRIFGLDPAQPSPTYEILLRDHIHPEDAAEMDRIFHKALEQGTSFEKEHRVIRPDGTVRWAYSKAKPYFDEHGKLLRYIGTSLDITDRKQAEAELEKARAAADAANRAKTDFLATMSHEFRTPLNAIIGFSEILADQLSGPLNDKQARQVGHILTGGRHLLSLVNDILDLAKVESGKMELSLTAVNLSTLINGSLLVIRERALHHAIRLEVDLEPDLTELTINADERKLKQIMFNLLSNAVKYTPEEGEIKVGGKKSDGTIQISVSDTGIGILPEDQERIFGSFEQVNSSLSLQQEGTGLGLALTRRLVELHGGKIWVESNGNGPGSVFCFTIPLEAATAAQESEDS